MSALDQYFTRIMINIYFFAFQFRTVTLFNMLELWNLQKWSFVKQPRLKDDRNASSSFQHIDLEQGICKADFIFPKKAFNISFFDNLWSLYPTMDRTNTDPQQFPVQLDCPQYSIGSSYSGIAARLRFSKYICNLLRMFWLLVRIAFFTYWPSCIEVGPEVYLDIFSQISKRTRPVR